MKKFFQQSFLKKLFFSYLIVLVFALGIGVFLFVYTLRRLEKDTFRFSQIALEQVSEAMNRMEDDIYSSAYALTIRSEYQALIYADPELTVYKRQDIAALQKEMLQTVASSNYISAIYIWFDHPQLAATTSGMLKGSDSLNRTLEKDFGITLEEIKALLDSSNFSICLSGSDIFADRAFVLFNNSYGASGTDVIFLLELDISAIRNILSAGSDEDTLFWAVSRQTGLIVAPNVAKETALAFSDCSPGEDQIMRVSLERNDYALLSDEGNDSFLLVSAMNYQSYHQTLTLYGQIFAGYLLIALALGILLSMQFSRANYRPVQEVKNRLSDYAPESDMSNDFEVLEAGIQSLLEKSRDYDQIYTQARRHLLDSFLSSLLVDGFSGNFGESCASLGLSFSSSRFLVIGIAIKNYDNLFLDHRFSEDKDLALFSVYSVISENLEENFSSAACRYEKRIWAIVSLCPDSDESSALQSLQDICTFSEAFLREKLGIPTWIFISNIYSPDAYAISRAYQEALWGLEQLEAYNVETPVHTVETVRLHTDSVPSFGPPSLDQAQKQQTMIQAAIRADYEEADRLYLEIRQQYTWYSFSLVRAQTMILLDYMVSFLPPELTAENAQIIQSFRNHIYHETKDQQLISLMHTWMICFHDIHQCMRPQAQDKAEALAIQATQYINDYYTDPDLNVSKVAQQLSVSTSYLSKVFQKAYGTGVLDCIHQHRLHAADILLKESDLTVEAIVGQVGYASSLAFIRAFKRYRHCTPHGVPIAALPSRKGDLTVIP